ncbi:RES family NAD+ phosphorylase [Microbulbifer bruguierae]|uniref:RES family NAD+ phosphorylase n=1 Tax=Microbulbifer bruguierae TaxID=3029061 RepID=A0ABY8NEF7_9GAMM|nr:RES family NAD+ phosphorylase [Microbulbifer bruguierae]WGL17303.1 RES family NAD+ phosphorylase [Microbulbifer bruguierae]
MIDLREKIRHSATRLIGRLYRIIESQEEVATRSLVDNLHKQEILEKLLEQSKPARLPGSEHLHYLLATPFRYPPLPWGSRFGRCAEAGIFYGSKSIDTVLAEAAYYRLLFLNDMQPSPNIAVTSYHQVFSAKYCADPGVRLQAEPWRTFWPQITHLRDYTFCQDLGNQLRSCGIQGIETFSARALCAGVGGESNNNGLVTERQQGVNVAIFEPEALLKRPPTIEAEVTAEATHSSVHFLIKSGSGLESRRFFSEDFLDAGSLPLPAG